VALEIEIESTEYVYLGVTGTVPATGADIAFMTGSTRPGALDWNPAELIPNSGDPLWDDAVAAVGAGSDYYVAVLVGAFGTGGVELAAGTYMVWLRLTDTIEQPVREVDLLTIDG
jgi:hypothetical protein